VFKWIVQIKKKAGMSREEFIDYYENQHEPLIRRVLPRYPIYRRNYLLFDDPMLKIDGRGGDAAYAGYDVLTESVFATRQDAEKFMAAFAQPDVFETVKADEANFVEQGHAKMFVVEVYQSKIP
jgi:EthD domain